MKEVVVVTEAPTVSELPETVRQFVSDGSKEAHSVPNGSCLFGTTIGTTIIARDANTHIASYRSYHLQKIQADFPLTLTIDTEGKKNYLR